MCLIIWSREIRGCAYPIYDCTLHECDVSSFAGIRELDMHFPLEHTMYNMKLI
jgi:hypothetical protein